MKRIIIVAVLLLTIAMVFNSNNEIELRPEDEFRI
jgi:hypothetical protein